MGGLEVTTAHPDDEFKGLSPRLRCLTGVGLLLRIAYRNQGAHCARERPLRPLKREFELLSLVTLQPFLALHGVRVDAQAEYRVFVPEL